MRTWAGEIKAAAAAVILLALLTCGIYPLAVWSLGQLLFPGKADGSLLKNEEKIIGSVLIAQPFSSAAYFHPRPSAVGYSISGARSGGSNLGPLSRSLREGIATRAAAYRRENEVPAGSPIAPGAVCASASGLDPHISPFDAEAQAARVARARGWSIGQVRQWIRRYTGKRQLGLFGEERINVLLLNLALDARP